MTRKDKIIGYWERKRILVEKPVTLQIKECGLVDRTVVRFISEF